MVDAQLSKDLSVPNWNVSRTRYFLKSLNQRTRIEQLTHTQYPTLLNLWMKWGNFNMYFLGYAFLGFRIEIYECSKSYKIAVWCYSFSQVNISPPSKRWGPDPHPFSSSSPVSYFTSAVAATKLHCKEYYIHWNDRIPTQWKCVCFFAKLADRMGSPCNPSGTKSNVTDRWSHAWEETARRKEWDCLTAQCCYFDFKSQY